MLALSGGYLCSQRINYLRRRVSVSRGLCAFIRYAKGQIERYAMPATEILRRCPSEILSLCGYAGDCLPSDLVSFCNAIVIEDGECKRIFSEFASDMGSCYREEQVKRCDELLCLLSEREKYLSDRLPVECKLTLALFCSAVIAVIILLL